MNKTLIEKFMSELSVPDAVSRIHATLSYLQHYKSIIESNRYETLLENAVNRGSLNNMGKEIINSVLKLQTLSAHQPTQRLTNLKHH